MRVKGAIQKRQEKMQPDKPVEREATWRPAFEEVLVPVTARWNAGSISLKQLAELEVGSVLPMPAAILEQTVILIGAEEKFTGTVGLEGDRVAVSITSARNK